MLIVLALVALILVGGFLYTFKLSRDVTVRKSEYDTEISAKVEKHPYLLNPVFLAYIIGIGAVLIYIAFFAF
jgi:hypothetical protein